VAAPMSEKDTWLSEELVLHALEEAVRRIRQRNLNGALDTLIYLNFDQLSRRQNFGPDRVRETGEQIRLCEIALRKPDANQALTAGQAALNRWQQP